MTAHVRTATPVAQCSARSARVNRGIIVSTFAYDVGSSWRPFDWPTQASTS